MTLQQILSWSLRGSGLILLGMLLLTALFVAAVRTKDSGQRDASSMAGSYFAPLSTGTDIFARALDGGKRFPEYSRRRADVDLDMAVGCFLCRNGDGFSMEAGPEPSEKGPALSRCLLPSVARRRDK